MISFSRISAAIAGLCLVGAALYYYKNDGSFHQTSDDSYQLSDQRFLVQSAYEFPLLGLDKANNGQETPSLPFIFKKLISPQSTVLHLGTHAGLHTILIAKQLKDTGKILAFEGHPKLFSLLKDNIEFHKLGAVIQPFPVIPSFKGETLSICLDASSENSADTAVDASYEQSLKGANCYDIQLKPLNDFALPTVDFVLIENNIDVSQTFEGAYAFLEKSKWPPLFIVPSIALSHDSHKQWIMRLKQEGYYFYEIKPTSKTSFTIRQINPYAPSLKENTYLFFSRELLPMSMEE